MATKGFEFSESISELDRLIGVAKELENLDQQDYVDAFTLGIPEAEKMAGRFLKANFASSGVKSNTGDLLKAVANPTMTVSTKKDGVFVNVQPAPGNTNKMFTILSSVNYGRVNSKDFDVTTTRPSTMAEKAANFGRPTTSRRSVGAKGRANLKNAVQNLGNKQGVIKAGRGLSFSSASIEKTKAGSTKVSTSGGSATVTKAFDFYHLKPSQSRQVLGVLFRGAAEHLKKKVKDAFRR